MNESGFQFLYIKFEINNNSMTHTVPTAAKGLNCLIKTICCIIQNAIKGINSILDLKTQGLSNQALKYQDTGVITTILGTMVVSQLKLLDVQ